MQLSDFNFHLPDELIATFPSSPRDHSRLLVVNRKSSEIAHHHFYDLPTLLKANDLLILNNTKVFPARLYGQDEKGRKFEIFLLKKIISPTGEENAWTCLAKPGKKLKSGATLYFAEGVKAFAKPDGNDSYEIVFDPMEGAQRGSQSSQSEDPWMNWLYRNGRSPLPPYIKREATEEDKKTYQTVYAKESGSIAAPTAGLHFTPTLFEKLASAGILHQELTLHVGYGTFTPIRATDLKDHQMHAETYAIPDALFRQIESQKSQGGRIVAVGTTSLRALESAARSGRTFGETNLFITPGYPFKVVDALVTNFHLPESSLFVLVCALAGIDLMQKAYSEAIAEKYRFYSYGDAMLIL